MAPALHAIDHHSVTSLRHRYRDICRFWRLLLIDLVPNCPQMLELFSDFFEYMDLILRRASSDESLRFAESLRAAWMSRAVQLFGKEEFQGMIKFHAPLHYLAFIKSRGGLPWWHDEDGEASLRPNAKNLLKRTNMGQNLEAQLAQVAERRDTERLIWQVLKQQRLAGGAAQPAPAQLPAPALLPVGPPTVLMGQRPAVRMMRRDVQAAHPDLAQIEFATRLYLHLAQSPQNDENVHLRDMPSLASEALDLRPGVHVLRWLASEPGVWRGGHTFMPSSRQSRSTVSGGSCAAASCRSLSLSRGVASYGTASSSCASAPRTGLAPAGPTMRRSAWCAGSSRSPSWRGWSGAT